MRLTTGNDNTSTTYSGGMSGSGGLTKIGTGAFVLLGANSYTGATTITDGTLQAGALNVFAPGSDFNVGANALLNLNNFNQTIGSLAGSGPVTLGAATLTAGNDNTSTTYSGGISGSGGLTKIGTQLRAQWHQQLYRADDRQRWHFVGERLDRDSTVIVNAGGTLGGAGVVGNTIVSGGTLAPGNSIGTITIQGDLALSTAATYLVQVSPTAADRTNVTGTASLAGTVQTQFSSGSYNVHSYTIVSALGGRVGTFDALTTSGLPAGFAASLSYDNNDAILNLTAVLGQLPTTVSNIALNQNQRNVANALNTFFNTGGTLTSNFIPVFGLTGTRISPMR